jgi:hypothetical protein
VQAPPAGEGAAPVLTYPKPHVVVSEQPCGAQHAAHPIVADAEAGLVHERASPSRSAEQRPPQSGTASAVLA